MLGKAIKIFTGRNSGDLKFLHDKFYLRIRMAE